MFVYLWGGLRSWILVNSMKRKGIIIVFFLTMSFTGFCIEMPWSGKEVKMASTGMVFEPGGGDCNYGNNLSSELTLLPTKKGEMVVLTFSSFLLDHLDYLDIYNGTEADPRNLIARYSGRNLPKEAIGANKDGALTLKFHSDEDMTEKGFVAEISNIPCPKYTDARIDQPVDSICPNLPLPLSLEGEWRVRPLIQWQSSTDDNNWKNLSEKSSTFTVRQTTPTLYRASLTCPTLISSYTTSQKALGISSLCYCRDNGTTPMLFNTSNVSITGTSLNNTTFSTDSTFTSFPSADNATCTLIKGNTYELSVTTQEQFMVINAWLDWDRSGTFDADEYVLVKSFSLLGVPNVVSFTVPESSESGLVGLRISTHYPDPESNRTQNFASKACQSRMYGEVEDYLITITPPVACPAKISAGITQSSLNAACPTKPILLTLPRLLQGAIYNYQWQRSSDNQTWLDVVGATKHYYETTQREASYYRCKISCGSQEATSVPTFVALSSTECEYQMVYNSSESIRTCSGSVTSNGGDAYYRNNSSDALTIYPDLPNHRVKIDFFYSIYDGDFLSVSDGVSKVNYSGDGTIEPIEKVSRNSDGSLKLDFTSDGSIVFPGFIAYISCLANCDPQMVVETKKDKGGYCYGESFELSLSDNFDNATYQWQVSRDSIAWTDLFDSVSSTCGGLAKARLLYRCKINCGNTVILSEPISIESYGHQCYCSETLSEYGCGEARNQNIANVHIKGTGLNNDSYCNVTKNKNNYSFFEPTSGATALLEAGQEYEVSVEMEQLRMNASVWIDYDQNGLLEKSEWSPLLSNSGMPLAIGVLKIPSSAKQGSTRMRVRIRNESFQNDGVDACSLFGSGETEDYIVTINSEGLESEGRMEESAVLLVPNPASSHTQLYLSEAEEDAIVSLIDIAGKKMLNPIAYKSGMYLYLETLPKGVYFVLIEKRDSKNTKILIVE